MNDYLKNRLASCIITSFIGMSLIACGPSSKDTSQPTSPPNPKPAPPIQPQDLGITDIPSHLAGIYTPELKFDRYTKVSTPNGGAIHIVAQNEIEQSQIIRARNILEHYLRNYPGSEYGSDKSAIANKMSDNGAILQLLNGVDDGSNAAAELGGQPLYYGEMQVEGGDWYINQNYEHRDASYEEILHLVHDYGIGVDQNPVFIGALPQYQAEIRVAQVDALATKKWAADPEQASWVKELTVENSLTQEYLASVIDTYYGLWGAFNGEGGMYGIYIAKNRNDIAKTDPVGAELLNNKFFHPYITYNARIKDSFSGAFSLKYNPELPYTHHSQYLKDVTLTGIKNSNVIVNGLDNNITGNEGTNTVIFSGPSSEYQYEKADGKIRVSDQKNSRDGINTLEQIEFIQFTDLILTVSDI